MTKKIKLCKKSLRIIILIQAKKKLAINESILSISKDWYMDTKKYYQNFPSNMLSEVGLVKTDSCFNAILKFKVTKVMKHTIFESMAVTDLSY